MVTSLQFARDGVVHFDNATDARGTNCPTPRGIPLEDPVAAVQAALADPIDFPALSLMVLPDDHVGIALEPGLACAPQLVAGLVRALMAAGSPAELIQIVRDIADRAITDKQLLAGLEVGLRDRIKIVHHDPADRECLSYLGATQGEDPIYVNRVLFDAEVVIPLGQHQSHDQVSCLGIHHGWFPVFSDLTTQARFHKALAKLSKSKIKRRTEELNEAAWMLGVQMAVQLVPAGNDRAMCVLAGAPDPVWKQARERARETWQAEVPERYGLVVSAIGGGPEQQTWENVVRAIEASLDVLETDGSIAICSQLKTKAGPAMRRLASAEDYEAAERAIRKKAEVPDSLVATRLNRALQRARVYLLSDLDENDVEDVGIAYVADTSEINKLVAGHASCYVIENAQHVSFADAESDVENT